MSVDQRTIHNQQRTINGGLVEYVDPLLAEPREEHGEEHPEEVVYLD